jgi:cell division septation protein DedD
VNANARRTAGVVLGLLVSAAEVLGQQAPPDSVFRRAQRLVNEGASAEARRLLDSLVRVSADGSEARAEALCWRATFASDSQSAQADYLTIVVDHELSPRAADALLRLGRVEFEHGDRGSAVRHLERLVLEHASAEAASEGWYWLGRARLLDGDLAGGCSALDSALRRLPESDVERRRPAQHYALPCKDLAAGPTGATTSDTGAVPQRERRGRGNTANPVRRDTAAPSGRRDTAPAKPQYSVQIAAYDSRAGADVLAKKMIARGYAARVDSLRLFHVRIGLYATRAAAVAVVDKLKQQGQAAIVVEVERREP